MNKPFITCEKCGFSGALLKESRDSLIFRTLKHRVTELTICPNCGFRKISNIYYYIDRLK